MPMLNNDSSLAKNNKLTKNLKLSVAYRGSSEGIASVQQERQQDGGVQKTHARDTPHSGSVHVYVGD